jgi:alpha-beta hydrolase superfamily lysophospholipase
MSVDTLIKDSIEVIKHVCKQYSDRSIIMVGHSMGGAIATKTVANIHKNYPLEEWTK